MPQKLRRGDRELPAQAAQAVLEKGAVCHLAMVDKGEPYLVTLNYGFRDSTLYFHCAKGGRKMEALAEGRRVCFTVVPRHELAVAEQGCDYSMRYESVVGYGTVRFLEEAEEKRRGLGIIMAQYASGEFSFPDGSLARTVVFAVSVEELTGKSSY